MMSKSRSQGNKNSIDNVFKGINIGKGEEKLFTAEDGSLGVFLVNYVEKDITLDYTIDPVKYGSRSTSGQYIIKRITPEGSSVEGTVKQGIIRRSETLGPLEIRLLQISGK